MLNLHMCPETFSTYRGPPQARSRIPRYDCGLEAIACPRTYLKSSIVLLRFSHGIELCCACYTVPISEAPRVLLNVIYMHHC